MNRRIKRRNGVDERMGRRDRHRSSHPATQPFLPLLFLIALTLLPLPTLARESLENLKDPNYWSQLCTLLSTTKPEEALTACERAIELRQGDPQLWARYGQLQVKLKKYPEALASLTQAVKRQSKYAQALTDQCVAWIALKQKDAAILACEQALKINRYWGNRSPVIAQHYRSVAIDQPEVYQQAVQFYDQALTEKPNDSLTLFYRAEALEKIGKDAAAIESSELALKGNGNWDPETPMRAWYVRGLAHRNLSQLEFAAQAFDQAIHLEPNDGDSWFQLGQTLRQLKRPTEALVALNRAVELQPKAAQVLLAQCIVLNQLQQAEAALAACQKAIQGDSNWQPADIAQAWNQQSQALTVLGKLEEALAAANRAVGMRPDWAEAWSDRSVVLWYLQKYDEALASVQKSLELNSQDARAWANQGRILRSLNQPENALAAYAESLKRDPQDAGTWANQSVVQWSLGDYPAALDSANQAITANPKLAQGWQNRAVALVALENYPEAQASYEQAVSLDAKNADAWTGLGLVLAQQKQYEAAMESLQTALNLNPNNLVAQQALKAITEAQQQSSLTKP
ncbi:MAG: tetratricopeptide repeat protein [Scytolyngbya sp. HA4215-MV1]|nr:tetratricopeptide repeat protein [Scytolyngbya sp. HA4215-MV1]